jgi:hypothetical protein
MTTILREPATGANVWRGPDFAADERWVTSFSTADLAEINAALAATKAAGCSPLSFGKADFPLPTLAAKIEDILHDVQHGRGFAIMRGLPVEQYSREDLEAIYWGLGCYMGRPISQNAEGHLLAEVTDKGSNYATNVNDRGYRSRDKLNPHVDTSDMTALLCVHQAEDGGLSSIASSAAVYNEVLAQRPDLLLILAEGFHHDLRGEGPTGSFDEVTHSRIPVFSYHQGQLSCCYNDKIMRSAHVKCGKPLSTQELEAIDLVLDTAESPAIRLDFRMQQGDIQFVNNYVLLHFRSAFESPPDSEQPRLLLRLWMNNYEPRPLAADFADRYNTGPRGGVFSAGAQAAE